MKLNKWTVGLAALGLVSLSSAVKADEAASSAVTAMTPTSISGYVDTSAQWNIGTGDANLPPYKFGGPSKADGFNLDVVQLRVEKSIAQDEQEWAAGYRADLWFGPDADTLNTQSINSTGSGDFAIRQAYVSLRAPVGHGLDFKMGVFDSILGYEPVSSPDNPNYSRSYGHTIEPQTMTGLLMSYHFCDWFSASAGIANTLGSTINAKAQGPNGTGIPGFPGTSNTKAESFKAYMGSMQLMAPDSWGFLAGSTLYGGIATGFNENAYPWQSSVTGASGSGSFGANETSYYVGATIKTPLKDLICGVAFDYLATSLSGENWTIGTYASFRATDKLSFHGRGEFLKDRGNAKFFAFTSVTDNAAAVVATAPDEVFALTIDAQYDLWKNVITRIEFRWDCALSGPQPWGGSQTVSADNPNGGGNKSECMLALNVIYKF